MKRKKKLKPKKKKAVIELYLGIDSKNPAWIFYEKNNFKSKKIQMLKI